MKAIKVLLVGITLISSSLFGQSAYEQGQIKNMHMKVFL
jgi:hypothetical protein